MILLLCFISCKAQTITIPIDDRGSSDTAVGTYYKDFNNLLNPFEGTWLYTNGTTSLLIKLRKIIKNNNTLMYQDLLVGEYQYIENGVEKINTLNSFNENYVEQQNHSISGNFIKTKYEIPPCNDCSINEKRVLLMIGDPVLDVAADMVIRKIVVNGQEALSIYMRTDGIKYTGDSPDTFNSEFVGSTMPNGNYVLIKQP